jgi:GxxExxY protein
MTTNLGYADESKILHKDLSHKIVGILIEVHKELGSYAREKQYCDLFEKKIKEQKFFYKRELRIGDSGNIIDFTIDEKIIIEFKAKPFLTAEDYNQIKRYLFQTGFQLGILVNFRDKRISPKRVLNNNNLSDSAEHL